MGERTWLRERFLRIGKDGCWEAKVTYSVEELREKDLRSRDRS